MILMTPADKCTLSLFQKRELLEKNEILEYINLFSKENFKPMAVDIKLKHSQYNIIKQKRKTYLLYNSLFNSMLTMSVHEFEQYKNIEFNDLSLVETFVDNGFLIPEYIDEFAHYNYYQENLNDLLPPDPHYTIVLTSKCNARCIYCYEEGIKQYDMSEECAGRIADVLLKSDKKIDITWFGGEPLLKTELIDIISDKLIAEGKEFKSGIITNGSLLTEDIILNCFPKWRIKWIQITIDGMNHEYAKRKCYYDTETDYFSKIMGILDILLNQDIVVNIRLNTDSENKQEIISTAEYLKNKYSSYDNLEVYPAFLSGDNNIITSMVDRNSFCSEIYRMFPPENGLIATTPRISACFFQQKGDFVIDTDGSILCCDRDVGKHRTKIADIFKAENFDELSKPEDVIPEVRKQCMKCPYYPKCSGGCRDAYKCRCVFDACFMDRYKLDFILDRIIDI